jgi:hypothetical protein
MFLLKFLNPLIWAANLFWYMGHLEMYRISGEYELYDFGKDWGYF